MYYLCKIMKRMEKTNRAKYRNSLADIILPYWKVGYRQVDVVTELNVSKQVVSKWYKIFEKNNNK